MEINGNTVQTVYVGNNEVIRIYQGETIVYEKVV